MPTEYNASKINLTIDDAHFPAVDRITGPGLLSPSSLLNPHVLCFQAIRFGLDQSGNFLG